MQVRYERRDLKGEWKPLKVPDPMPTTKAVESFIHGMAPQDFVMVQDLLDFDYDKHTSNGIKFREYLGEEYFAWVERLVLFWVERLVLVRED